MNNLISHSYLILLFPLLSFVINGLFLCFKHRKAAAILSTSLSGLGAIFAIFLVVQFFISGAKPLTAWEFEFLSFSGNLIATIGCLLDSLSAMMVLTVSLIAFVVHIYSIGYMQDDLSSGRFFALLSLFVFSMLGLVIATNIFQTFIFWELVGVSSYLLIGFWYNKPSAVAASKQAFILTRFADSFFLLGIILLSYIAKSFVFSDINSLRLENFAGQMISLGIIEIPTNDALVLSTLLIFIGGWGKSAMFPLHIWLPNAMEGPTPVSSIIHSATMVVAGVYLVARLFPLFAISGNVLEIVMIVGTITMLFAAIIACTQKDIKRILAYSTLSQLGYMMLALGSAKLIDGSVHTLGYTAATFHIFTHAFFKCMLFLIAGALIHQVHTNDLDAMGGLRKKMPWTYAASLIACLAIAGIPPFSGFYSKDEILITAYQAGHPIIFACALFTSFLTAFYMFRLFFLAFHGKMRSVPKHPVHESLLMTLPILLLVIPTIFAGFSFKNIFHHFFTPENITAISHNIPDVSFIPPLAICCAVIGIIFSYILYASPKANLAKALDSDNRNTFYKTIYNKFYFDEIYYTFVRQFILGGLASFARFLEEKIIGSLVNFFTTIIHKAGSLVRSAHCGYIPFYIGVMILGVLFWYFASNLPLQGA